MKLRGFLVALVAAFETRERIAPAHAIETTREAARDGLVSEHTAFRVRTAFERFSRSLFGGGR